MNTLDYIVVNKTTIEKRIEECDKKISILQRVAHNQLGRDLEITNISIAKLNSEKDTLKQMLSQSTPLIPEIENAFHEGTRVPYDKSKPLARWWVNADQRLEKYISNLKLDI